MSMAWVQRKPDEGQNFQFFDVPDTYILRQRVQLVTARMENGWSIMGRLEPTGDWTLLKRGDNPLPQPELACMVYNQWADTQRQKRGR